MTPPGELRCQEGNRSALLTGGLLGQTATLSVAVSDLGSLSILPDQASVCGTQGQEFLYRGRNFLKSSFKNFLKIKGLPWWSSG